MCEKSTKDIGIDVSIYMEKFFLLKNFLYFSFERKSSKCWQKGFLLSSQNIKIDKERKINYSK